MNNQIVSQYKNSYRKGISLKIKFSLNGTSKCMFA